MGSVLKNVGDVQAVALLAGQAAEADPANDARIREILGSLQVAVYTTDALGRITFYNETAAALWGVRPELGKSQWCGSWKLSWPDGRPLPHDECPMAMALKGGEAIQGMEAIAERPDGTRVPFEAYPTPLYDATGVLVGGINLLVDVSDRRRAEQYERRLAAIVEASDDAIISKNLDGVITSWNRGAENLFGYKADEAVGQPVAMLIPDDHIDEESEILGRLRRGEHVDHYETVRRRKDGSLIEISLSVSPVKDGSGRIVGASKIARDITDRRRAEKIQDLVVGEMRHRIKNTLTTVRVVATQTIRNAPDDEMEAFMSRLQALSAAHDLLGSGRWDQALLGDVVRRAVSAFATTYGDRIAIEGPAGVHLGAERALSLTLALHELATNAVKYGALSNEVGRVEIDWRLAPGPGAAVIMRWREHGGPKVVPPTRQGFGSRLIERTFGDGTTLDYAPDGFACTMQLTIEPA